MSGKAHTAVHDVMKYNSSHEKTNFWDVVPYCRGNRYNVYAKLLALG